MIKGHFYTKGLILLPMLVEHPHRLFCTENLPPPLPSSLLHASLEKWIGIINGLQGCLISWIDNDAMTDHCPGHHYSEMINKTWHNTFCCYSYLGFMMWKKMKCSSLSELVHCLIHYHSVGALYLIFHRGHYSSMGIKWTHQGQFNKAFYFFFFNFHFYCSVWIQLTDAWYYQKLSKIKEYLL